jgi:YesN/AraC family two-component response regulator
MNYDESNFAYRLQTSSPITCTMAGIRKPIKIFQHQRRVLPDFASFIVLKGNFFVKDELGENTNEDKISEGMIHTIAPGIYQQNTQPMQPGHLFLWFHFTQEAPIVIVSLQETIRDLTRQSQQNAPQKYLFIPRHYSLKEILFETKHLHDKLLQNIQFWGNQDYGTHLLTNQLLYLQHIHLAQKLIPEQSHESQKRIHVRKAQIFIQDNFKTIQKVTDVSSHLNLNASYLSRVFKEYAGVTITSFIQTTKISVAKKIIQQGETNIKKVAYEVGYTDLNYFCRNFKKITGDTTRSLKR